MPVTAPIPDSDGEIPETPRGAGFETVDGFRDRTPWTQSFDLHFDYRLRLFGDRSVLRLADVFNVFDPQDVTGYDNYTESAFQVPDPDFGRVISGAPATARRRAVRLVGSTGVMPV